MPEKNHPGPGAPMKILTVFEASQFCGVSAKTITNWIEAGHIKAFRTVGGHRRISISDLNAFLKERQMPTIEESSLKEEPSASRRRILIVDDDRIIVETLVLAMEEEDRDYEIISASDGFEAGIQINRFKPHLVILDIMMPDINGYEVCRRIKMDDETKATKVIVLSAYLDEDSYRKMREYGADLCYSKPLPLDQLKAEVARLLGLPSKTPTA